MVTSPVSASACVAGRSTYWRNGLHLPVQNCRELLTDSVENAILRLGILVDPVRGTEDRTRTGRLVSVSQLPPSVRRRKRCNVQAMYLQRSNGTYELHW